LKILREVGGHEDTRPAWIGSSSSWALRIASLVEKDELGFQGWFRTKLPLSGRAAIIVADIFVLFVRAGASSAAKNTGSVTSMTSFPAKRGRLPGFRGSARGISFHGELDGRPACGLLPGVDVEVVFYAELPMKTVALVIDLCALIGQSSLPLS